jgi:hypothetical protein
LRNRALTFLLVCAIAPTYVLGGDDADAESKLVALENLWNRAAEDHDLRALSTILDDSFIYVDRNGRLLTKAEVLEDVKTAHGIQVSSESVDVHLHGDIAIVTGIYKTAMMDHGKRIVYRDHFLDTWRLEGGSWIAIASLTTPTEP